MKISIDTRQVEGLAVKMKGVGNMISRESKRITSDMADELVKEIRDHAPVDTGAYRNSWQARYAGIFEGFVVSTSKPQARRLEYGFYGTDSLGRNYNQAPQPHVRPAAAKVATMYGDRFRRLIKQSWDQA